MTGNGGLRRLANAFARTTLSGIPLQFWQRVFPKDLIALCYHVVSDDDLPHVQLYPFKTPAQFGTDVAFARPWSVTYQAVVRSRVSGEALPRNSILFTFDDGFAQCFDVVRPILIENEMDGVFFVSTSFIDNREIFSECALSLCISASRTLPIARVRQVAKCFGVATGLGATSGTRTALDDHRARIALVEWLRAIPLRGGPSIAEICLQLGVDPIGYARANPIFMTSDQVRQLALDGFTVGAHGLNHRSLEHLSVQEIEREMVASCLAVSEITKQKRVPFAFPYSGLAVERDAIAGILRRNSFIELVFDSGCLRRDPRFIVNRVFNDPPSASDSSNLPNTLCNLWSQPSAWFRAS
jgi:peptidoglycan/xylan/chitin deacetylase (PgdA/CDA1 family)